MCCKPRRSLSPPRGLAISRKCLTSVNVCRWSFPATMPPARTATIGWWGSCWRMTPSAPCVEHPLPSLSQVLTLSVMIPAHSQQEAEQVHTRSIMHFHTHNPDMVSAHENGLQHVPCTPCQAYPRYHPLGGFTHISRNQLHMCRPDGACTVGLSEAEMLSA